MASYNQKRTNHYDVFGGREGVKCAALVKIATWFLAQ